MPFDFDTIIPRNDTYSFKWQKYAGRDVIPTWVADTEFRCAPPILAALAANIEHGVMGYTLPAQYEPANLAVQRWLSTQHDWQIELDWIVWVPGVVPGFNMACKAVGQTNDHVLIQTPNYPPLLAASGINHRQRVNIPTIEQNGRWTIDLDQLEAQAQHPDCHLMILCNPMNPVGSVFSQAELDAVADICERNNVVLCSDEIHCDLILEQGVKHLPAGKHAKLADRSITLMAASKTFNVAGLGAAFAIIPDPALRAKFSRAGMGMVPWVNIQGLVATHAAFTECDDWHQALLTYLRGNRDETIARVNAIEGLRALTPQATFLAWVDASGLGVEDVQAWCENKGVGPSPGADFGAPEYFRLNYGCSRQMLDDILTRLER